MTETEALAFVNDAAAAQLFVAGQWVQLAIAEANTGQLAGDIGICVAENAGSAEIGFTLSPTATGKGYATAAVRETIHLLFECTFVERIIGVTDARNTPSVRLLERVGMTRVESRETVFRESRAPSGCTRHSGDGQPFARGDPHRQAALAGSGVSFARCPP